MTQVEGFLNLVIGIVGGIIASVLTLLGDRKLRRSSIEKRLRSIAGDYRIESNTPQRDTAGEKVSIRLVAGRRFCVEASGGPVGDWSGHFIVQDDFHNVAHGVFRYKGSRDWGQHEYLFDESRDCIYVYGINRSKPGLTEPWALVLSRWSSNDPPNVI